MTDLDPPRRQSRIRGSKRDIRHVVQVNAEQEKRLQHKAAEQGLTVARLLVDTTLGDTSEPTRRTLFQELDSVRKLFNVALTLHDLKATNDAIQALETLAKAIREG